MPHIVIEYSANVGEHVDIDALVRHMHDAAASIDIFPLGGIRTRAERRDSYRIADGHPDNGFVHVAARIGAGRSETVRQQAAATLFAALCEQLQTLYDSAPLGISLELSEADPACSLKRNNIHQRLAAASAAAHQPARASKG